MGENGVITMRRSKYGHTPKEIIDMTGLTCTDFSRKYEIPLRTVQDWYYGKRNPTMQLLNLLDFKVSYDCGTVLSD